MTSPQPRPSQPLLVLDHVSKVYTTGGVSVAALDDVSLGIHAGEFVAIMGQSGSGKSTLMNILGCLDRPSAGSYSVAGHDVATLSLDELASLRRDTFGFVFQRYNLLATATAAENVEIPAIYAGVPHRERMERAENLLARLGLADRSAHRPHELSGGQQQRVSIARALVNGAEVILADEPTGALDTRSGDEVLSLLSQLHAEGRTVILITHNAEIAAHAQRVIQISDGRVVEDTAPVVRGERAATVTASLASRTPLLPDLSEAVKMALRSLRTNLFRTVLTLLGVVIGVAAVVAMLAIGNGSKEKVLERISAMGTNLLLVRPGAAGVRVAGDNATLSPADAAALMSLPGVQTVVPERSRRVTLRFGNTDYSTVVYGAWPGYVEARDWQIAHGGFITDADVSGYAPVIVLGNTVARILFPYEDNPVDRYVLVGNVPFQVIGVLAPKGASAFGSDMDDMAVVPLSTGFVRLFGRQFVNTITVKVADVSKIAEVEEAITAELVARHRRLDFQVRNTASILETAEEAQGTLTVLLGSVAAISLLVGGIGVMNIMLVSVTERTREIGIRMATGARTGDILLQFNTEALVVCGIGGITGVILGVVVALVSQSFGASVAFSAAPALLAFGCAFLTGVLFGFLPARKAAHLDPVVALASD